MNLFYCGMMAQADKQLNPSFPRHFDSNSSFSVWSICVPIFVDPIWTSWPTIPARYVALEVLYKVIFWTQCLRVGRSSQVSDAIIGLSYLDEFVTFEINWMFLNSRSLSNLVIFLFLIKEFFYGDLRTQTSIFWLWKDKRNSVFIKLFFPYLAPWQW